MCSKKIIIIIIASIIILYILTKLNKKDKSKKENLTQLDMAITNMNTIAQAASNSTQKALNINLNKK